MRHGFEEVLWLEIWFPQTFAGTEKLVRCCPGDNEVFCEINATNRVEAVEMWLVNGRKAEEHFALSPKSSLLSHLPADEWLPCCLVDARHHR